MTGGVKIETRYVSRKDWFAGQQGGDAAVESLRSEIDCVARDGIESEMTATPSDESDTERRQRHREMTATLIGESETQR